MADLRALTRASTIGPLVEAVEARGGTADRLFRRAGLPMGLVDHPDLLVPLAFQTRLVEAATRTLDDPALPFHLAVAAGPAGLGPYARRFLETRTLREAAHLGNRIFTTVLQSSTVMEITVAGREARWSYRVDADLPDGRGDNELLAIGYTVAMLRRYAGAGWTPLRIERPAGGHGRTAVEEAARCDVTAGARAAVVFDAGLLDIPTPRPPSVAGHGDPEDLPAAADLPRLVRELVRLDLLEGRPRRERVARYLGHTTRTMQRRLAEAGTTFADAVRDVLHRRACELLERGVSVTDTAAELGYADSAHFARAFTGWAGRPPSAWARVRQGAAEA